MNQPFDPYAAPKAAVAGYAPITPIAAGQPIDFTATQVLKGSWAVFKASWKQLLSIYFAFGFGLLALGGATMWPILSAILKKKGENFGSSQLPAFAPADIVVASFGSIGIFILAALCTPGLYRAALNAVTAQPIPISLLWSEMRFALRYAGLMLWSGLMVVLGFFTLGIFSVWWIFATLPVWYIIIDKDSGVFDAIQNAKELTVARRSIIFGAYALIFLVSLPFRFVPGLNFLSSIVLSSIQQIMPAWIYAATQGTLPSEFDGQN